MSVPLSYLTALPTEILETILLHLPGQDIIKTEAVNKRFRDLVRNSPALQHRSELFDIGLIDNPRYPCDFTERRRLCSRYTHKWTSAKGMVKTTHAFYPAKSSSWTTAKYSGNGLFVSYPWKDEGLTFLYVPPVTSQRPPKTWSIPPFSFRAASYAAYPPENVVAIAELRQNSIRVHILNLRDGSPCDKPPSGIITWEAPSWANSQIVESMSMTSSRIATYLHCWCEQLPDCEVWKIIVWDWKMGNMVLDVQPTDWRDLPVNVTAQVVFLDEFRIAFLPKLCPGGELVVFDTLIPQHDPGSVQRFEFPRSFHGQPARIAVDRGRYLGRSTRDEAFIGDPSQAIFVVWLKGGRGPKISLILRAQTLLEQEYPGRAGFRVPWDAWRKYASIMEVPKGGTHIFTFVHNAQVMLVRASSPRFTPRVYYVDTFDFSRRGSLRLLGGADGSEGKALFEGEMSLEFKSEEGMDVRRNLSSLSDGTLFCLGTQSDGAVQLHLWEMV